MVTNAIEQGVRVSKKPRHTQAQSSAIIPSNVLGDPMDQVEVCVARAFPDQRSRSKKMAANVTPTHAKAFNNKPAMAQRVKNPTTDMEQCLEPARTSHVHVPLYSTAGQPNATHSSIRRHPCRLRETKFYLSNALRGDCQSEHNPPSDFGHCRPSMRSPKLPSCCCERAGRCTSLRLAIRRMTACVAAVRA